MLETLVQHLDMVRLTIAAALLLAAVGCTGLIGDAGGDDEAPGGLTPQQVAARKAWIEKALPQLNQSCLACHNGSMAGIDFITGNSDLEKRDNLLAFEPLVVNLDAPQSSRLLTKGLHSGPAFLAEQASNVLEWVQLEKDAQQSANPPTGPKLETAQFQARICTSGLPNNPEGTCPVNDVSLADIGAPGATISFVAQALGSGIYLNNLKLVPGPTGAFIEHPLFVSWPAQGEPIPDMIDRFFNVKMNLASGASAEQQQIAGGTAAFVGFQPNDRLTIHFKAVNVFQDEAPPPMIGGCKELGSFETNARALFNNNCGSCHRGQNGNATSALNMVGVDQANNQEACNQIRIRTNLNDAPNSGVFLATAPNNNNHPFRFPNQGAFDQFRNAVTIWINAERVAP